MHCKSQEVRLLCAANDVPLNPNYSDNKGIESLRRQLSELDLA